MGNQITAAVEMRLKRTVDALTAQIDHMERIGPKAYYGALFEEVPKCAYWVLTGCDRAHHIADKVSASLASTGTPSYFVDAQNGGGHVRLLSARDRLLLFHRRGEPTERLTGLLASLPGSVPLDVITDHPEGWPDRGGVILPVIAPDPVPPETERDVISLALGDSLVCGLESAREFTELDFLADHPKGSLGKNLSAAHEKGDEKKPDRLPPAEQALKSFEEERDGVKSLLDSLDRDIVKEWLDLFRRPWVRIITTGMGKPGYCMRYTALLMNELGRPAFYLHPAEGVHGDLGRIGPNSLVVAYSHSGETEEVLNVLPRMRERGAALLALTNNPGSTLAKTSDVVLKSGAPEVDPIRKAPTGSTTASLALMTALVSADLPTRW